MSDPTTNVVCRCTFKLVNNIANNMDQNQTAPGFIVFASMAK